MPSPYYPFKSRLTWVSRVKKVIQKFYWLITFSVLIEDKFVYQRWLRRKIAQKCLEILLLLYNLHILHQTKTVFLFSSNFC